MTLELGLDTFGDVTLGPDGKPEAQAKVLRDVVDQAVLADQVGVDVINLGEHHRDDFAISSPEVLLATIGARTDRIRLGTGVTVLSSDDPIRLFQRFSTLNAVTGGRGEVIVGRGSFTESFPLFGHDLRDYEPLFEEKLDLFTRLIREKKVSWQGKTRPPLKSQQVFPPLESPLKVWVGVGGSPESVVRAVSHDLPLMLAIIGGAPGRFKAYVDLYHRAVDQMGQAARGIGVHSPGFVAATDDEARDIYWTGYKVMHDRIGRERGWPPTTRADFLREVEQGSMYVGSPETVAKKIAATVRALGLSRFQMKYSGGPVDPARTLECVRLYGERVIPLVRQMVG